MPHCSLNNCCAVWQCLCNGLILENGFVPLERYKCHLLIWLISSTTVGKWNSVSFLCVECLQGSETWLVHFWDTNSRIPHRPWSRWLPHCRDDSVCNAPRTTPGRQRSGRWQLRTADPCERGKGSLASDEEQHFPPMLWSELSAFPSVYDSVIPFSKTCLVFFL